MKDALGQELQVGDVVVYPISYYAHSIGMRSARIVAIHAESVRVAFTDHIPHRHGRYGKAVGAFIHKVENLVKVL